jgi:hypothetical protein
MNLKVLGSFGPFPSPPFIHQGDTTVVDAHAGQMLHGFGRWK